MAVLALREYERITYGDKFDPLSRTVRLEQFRFLERFTEKYQGLHKVTVFLHGPRSSLVAQNFVGVINLGRDQIEVLPKIEGEVSQVRHNLTKMLATVLDLVIYDDELSEIEAQNDSVLEILIGLYCRRLWQCVRRGMVKQYETRSENLAMLRGRLSVTDQIRLNLARPEHLICVFDEFSDNHDLNRALKLSLRILNNVAKTQANQRQLAELIFCFQDVDDVVAESINWEKAKTNRLSARYKSVLSLARLLINGKSPDIISGSGDGFALLFDMNQLFEMYVGAVAKRVFCKRGLEVTLQGPSRYLATLFSGAPMFQLRPDIVVRKRGAVVFIIDTKWKRLKEQVYREGIASGDVYQMFAYATQYMAPDVMLLYPHHGELGTWRARRAEYFLNSPSGEIGKPRISVSSIDLQDLKTVPVQLELMFKEVGGANSFNSGDYSLSTPRSDHRNQLNNN